MANSERYNDFYRELDVIDDTARPGFRRPDPKPEPKPEPVPEHLIYDFWPGERS